MDNKIKAVIGLGIALFVSLVCNIALGLKVANKANLGANTQFGMPCIYTTATRTLSNGSGTAFSCDTQGRLIITN